jgi:hypothetical protein
MRYFSDHFVSECLVSGRLNFGHNRGNGSHGAEGRHRRWCAILRAAHVLRVFVFFRDRLAIAVFWKDRAFGSWEVVLVNVGLGNVVVQVSAGGVAARAGIKGTRVLLHHIFVEQNKAKNHFGKTPTANL